jgi:hypothetical protein
MSNGCTFAPLAIRGFDGSTCSRGSRFRTSARATTGEAAQLVSVLDLIASAGITMHAEAHGKPNSVRQIVVGL